ncbi:MAG: hypothetical protein EOM02_06095 [Synergistales bacterium]|nr:hypothetical protein [Synergistales bacterium]
MRYRKKPVEVEAFRWTGKDSDVLPEWLVVAMQQRIVAKRYTYLYIDTLEGTHRADPGDYIIQGVKGELYPCKPDIFEMTYEEVKE